MAFAFNNFFSRSTLILLRIPFSYLLMPVFFLGLNASGLHSISNAVLLFIVWHLFIYPSSNAYNSTQDNDSGSIGGVKNPPKPTKSLFYWTIILDLIGLLLSLYINVYVFLLVLIYIIASKSYSWRRLRLKKYPWLSLFIIGFFQGVVVFSSVSLSQNIPFNKLLELPHSLYALATFLMMAGIYPITQIFQHEDDLKDGIKSLSFTLGYKGTFIFSGIFQVLFLITLSFIWIYINNTPVSLLLFLILLGPSLLVIGKWAAKVWENPKFASYSYAMKTNSIAASCMNLFFIIEPYIVNLF